MSLAIQNDGETTGTLAALSEIFDKGHSLLETLNGIASGRIGTSSIRVRLVAIWALGLSGNKRNSKYLIDIFEDTTEDYEIRRQAAISLAQLGSKLPTNRLIRLLASDQEFVAKYAAYALGWSFDNRANEPLINALRNRTLFESVRAQAAESLGNLEAEDSRQPLIDCLSEEPAELKFWCLFALGHVGRLADIPKIIEHATDHRIVEGWWTVAKEAQDTAEAIRTKYADS